MSYQTITVDSEETMRNAKLKCVCGDFVEVSYEAKLGRVKNTFVTVFNVPHYSCNCGDSFMDGSDAMRFGKRVQEAVDSKLDSIYF